MNRNVSWERFESRPRLAVEGGVGVAKPGKVSGEEARDLVDAVAPMCSSAIASRARTYARQGQVVGVEIADRVATANIQGSEPEPYFVDLRRVATGEFDATCDCPYGCGPGFWCKHAAALALVVADLIDNDAAALQRWTGIAPATAPAGPAPPEIIARLRSAGAPRPALEDLMEAAAAVVPLPWP